MPVEYRNRFTDWMGGESWRKLLKRLRRLSDEQCICFNFNQNEVRTIVKEDGEIWFVLSDVCNVLEIGNPSDAARRLDNDEVTLDIIEGNHRPTNLVNESGLYSLVLTSRKPEAKQFKKWVTSDVLPSIRKMVVIFQVRKTMIPKS